MQSLRETVKRQKKVKKIKEEKITLDPNLWPWL
jgi:hypothetical protein